MNVSILLAVHNGEKHLEHALSSIAQQSYDDFEVVIVDDKSNDKTATIISTWSKSMNNKVKIVTNKKNLGLTKSLNVGLKKCSGEFIARIDADDIWHKEKLLLQMSFLDKNKSYGYIGSYYTNKFEASKTSKLIKVPQDDDQIRKFAFKRNPFAHSCIVIRKSLMDQVHGYDEKILYGQDYNLFMRCLPLTKFYNIPKSLCNRNIGKESISIAKQKLQAKQSLKTRLYYIKAYEASIKNYLYVVEPFLNAYTPEAVKKIKRKLF